jgi:hypothetical protein
MGSKLKMSTSFRPQTDGQTERVNLVIQQFLRNYVAADQQDWVDHLELAEFCYNNSEHSATGATPFQMVTGKSPIVPTTWVGQPPSDASEEVPMVTQLDEERRCRNPSFGLATKAKGLQGCGPKGSPGLTSWTPGSVGKREGVNPHTPKATPALGDGVPVDSQNFRDQFEGSNLNGL